MGGGTYMFVIVGDGDQPLYEAEFPSNPTNRREDNSHLNQFIIHAALDMVDEHVFAVSNMYLKVVDKFNDYYISSFVSAGHVRFMLLHDVRNEDGIKGFFHDVHELYIKVLLNPFYKANGYMPASFNERVKARAAKYFS